MQTGGLVRRIRAVTGLFTVELRHIAAAVACSHEDESPAGSLCAIVEDWLRLVLHGESSPLVAESRLAYLASLGHTNIERHMHRPIASAWIHHHLALCSAQALQRLKLVSGNEVHLENGFVDPGTGEVSDIGGPITVSSIGANGLVYF